METSYAHGYRDLYERHWWWRARERLVLDVLERLRPPHGWRSILDVGCGDALFFDELARFGAVEGVESDASLVSADGAYRDRIHLVPFDDRFRPAKQYSLILMLDVVEHLPDPVGALRHATSLLEPNGVVLVTVPAFMSLWTTHDELNHHYTRYTRRTFEAVARPGGLQVEVARYFFHWMWIAKLGLRVVETVTRSRPSPPRVPSAPVNRLLYWASVLEHRTVGRLPLPFGSSLLVVGRKEAESARSRPGDVATAAAAL